MKTCTHVLCGAVAGVVLLMASGVALAGGKKLSPVPVPSVYVSGHVKKEGKVPVKPGMTLHHAVEAAGGFGEFGDKTKVKVSRRAPKGTEPKVFIVDCTKPAADPAHEVTLEADDWVYVPAMGVSR